jgi:acyl carrier protein
MRKETIFAKIRRELSFIYDKEITLQTNFVEDLNMDRLDLAALISDIEDGFNINADNFSEKPLTVEDLVDKIWEQVRARRSMEIFKMLKYNPPCPFRLSTRECAESSEGKCCCECDKYENCEAACKNTPEKCGRLERWQKEEG